MRTLAEAIITKAAEKAGLPEKRVMGLSAADNLTLPRPRVELEFLPEPFTRTGRKLAVTRDKAKQTTKKELYEHRLEVTANVLADDEKWLSAFEKSFVAAFPRGLDDSRGNWVKILVQQATFTTPPAKRVGDKEIKVFTKVNTLFLIKFTGRITSEEEQDLITTFDIQVSMQP